MGSRLGYPHRKKHGDMATLSRRVKAYARKEGDMDLAFTGKRALVTGSTGGIGEGIAKMLAQEGAAVVVQGRNESAGSRVQREIEAVGGKAILAIGDLSTD